MNATVAAIILMVTAAPPHGMTLCDFGRDFDANQMYANNAEVDITASGALSVRTMNKNWPGVNIKAPQGKWDLSKYAYVTMDVANKSRTDLRIYCKLTSVTDSNEGDITGSIGVPPGQMRTLTVWFHPTRFVLDKPMDLAGMRTAPGERGNLRPESIVRLFVFLNDWSRETVFEVDNIRAAGEPKVYESEKFLPFIDQFGQFRHGDWPGKIHDICEFPQRIVEEQTDLAARPEPADWGKFGGKKTGSKLQATGFFRVEKNEGKWWLVDPEGCLFWSHGVDCVRMDSATPITGRDRYFGWLPDEESPFADFYGKASWAPHGYYQGKGEYRTFNFAGACLMWKFGDHWKQVSSARAHRRLRSWGLNTIGNWSDEQVYALRRTPYVATISYSGPKLEGSEGYWGKFYDVFDPNFRLSLRSRLGREKGKSAGDPWCLGYFVDNELAWGDETSLALATLGSTAAQAAKKVFVEDLKAKYETIGKLNTAWGTSHADWDGLLNSQDRPDVNRAGDDLRAFYTKTAERYFEIVRDEVKAVAHDQLYLGCRFAWGNDRAAIAAAKYCDVVSYNFYQYDIEARRLPGNIDKPIIIGEFHFGAVDRGMFHPGLCPTADQNDRAFAYASYVRGAMRNPQIVGTHWFQYQDQATTGRGDGENYQIGLVDIADTPQAEIIAACREVGYAMYEYRMAQ